ncbi:FAD binding domain-containing protein [Amniculicola lignicola CBS 123094]|uniref:FAD binding domain-containing protein n=1 Tax=Amniculicola lignicola CBS 123094 TaxID=1392246 RepID=A0A6A5X3G3_9PLEO|nr:FAD binding domain-containing protein [Amniculicola lignicola CBS 123094]
MEVTGQLPVIVVGGGIVGLALAQALKKEGIPFQLYERDQHLDARSAGWGITIHWALPAIESCLSPALFEKIDTIQVDPQQGLQDTGRFLFLDIETAEPRYVIPPSFRRRISRLKLRKLLTTGIDVNWNKSVSAFSPTKKGVHVSFTDGTHVEGSILVGADGSGSKTRRLLVGEEQGRLNQLPANFMGVTVRLTPEKVMPLREIDPLLFQGSHPDTGYFMWYSTLTTPEVNGSVDTDSPYFEGQLNISWLIKGPEDAVPATNELRLEKMKTMAKAGTGFQTMLRTTIEEIPSGTEVLEIKLADWPTVAWPSHNGRVTLLGDAAHAMTMYRGEAANHGMMDAAKLKDQLKLWHEGKLDQQEAIEAYEKELIKRGHDAVLLSRQACLDAHDIRNLHADSPLVSKRAKVLDPGVRA